MNSSFQFHLGALTTALLVALASVVNVSTQPETAKEPSPILVIASKLLD
ncbi:MAG: hypothetical protein HC827_18460 [Cyanobacteria bacterium RM1_2_2]|nr:hypothetical protein [Cyanobacteria bacterium RM1_2_2]